MSNKLSTEPPKSTLKRPYTDQEIEQTANIAKAGTIGLGGLVAGVATHFGAEHYADNIIAKNRLARLPAFGEIQKALHGLEFDAETLKAVLKKHAGVAQEQLDELVRLLTKVSEHATGRKKELAELGKQIDAAIAAGNHEAIEKLGNKLIEHMRGNNAPKMDVLSEAEHSKLNGLLKTVQESENKLGRFARTVKSNPKKVAAAGAVAGGLAAFSWVNSLDSGKPQKNSSFQEREDARREDAALSSDELTR